MIAFMETALWYASIGLPVLPLKSHGPGDSRKEPACAHGKDDATTDSDQIRQWWNRNPRYNIGARPPVGYAVLDVDPRNGGVDNMFELLDGRGLPETWTARTGSGGWHFWLKAHPPFRSTLCEGVDIKHNTGYVVMPPSVHPNGTVYQWVRDAEIAYTPVWLLSLMRPRPRQRFKFKTPSDKSTAGLIRAVVEAKAPTGKRDKGNRNNMLYWAARVANDEGTLDQIRDELESAARTAGLSESAIRATLRSAQQAKP